jgi:hypothetical protein
MNARLDTNPAKAELANTDIEVANVIGLVRGIRSVLVFFCIYVYVAGCDRKQAV